MAVRRALLLIADIGGYTRFMKVHRINLSHAQDIVARLLESVIDAATPRFKLSKLEGDAALFYAPLDATGPADLRALSEQVAAIRRAFVDRREQIAIDRVCTCDGCTQVGDLKLKFVAHMGEIALQRVKSFTELAGFDVIIVHRMLKNAVPVPEYVLMTSPVLEGLDPEVQAHAHTMAEHFEGVGETAVHYIDLDAIARALPPSLAPSTARRWWEHLKLNARSLPYMLGFKTPCEGFGNLDDALGRLPAPAVKAP